jgi:glycosyltransferase involved in cell wall biosynthesis
MYIGLFTDTYDEINGVGMTLRRLTDYAEEKGVYLEVFCPGEESGTEKRGSVKIHRYKPFAPLPIYSDLTFDLKFVRNRIVTYCEQAGFDLIHTATPGSMGLTALFIAHTQKIPLIGSYHTALPVYVKKRVKDVLGRLRITGSTSEEITWRYMAWYYGHTKLILAPSFDTKRELEKRLSVPIRIFSRGIETRQFNPKYRRDRLIEEHRIERPIALYVGRISVEKGLEVLVQIFRDRRRPQLVVVGDGPYLDEMKKALPNAIFLGFMKGEALSEIYASSDFFLFPSTTDTFGNVVLEALSSGLPAIVSDKGGPKELVKDGETGFVVKADNTEEFEEKIDLLTEDPGLRREMSKNAVRYAKARSWDKVFSRLFAIYKEVIDEVA